MESAIGKNISGNLNKVKRESEVKMIAGLIGRPSAAYTRKAITGFKNQNYKKKKKDETVPVANTGMLIATAELRALINSKVLICFNSAFRISFNLAK